MSTATGIIAVGLVWSLLIGSVMRSTTRSPQRSVGLPTAYVFAMSFMYCGALTYAVPEYSHLRIDGDPYLAAYNFTDKTVLAGAIASLLGMMGFALGCIVLSNLWPSRESPSKIVLASPQRRQSAMLAVGGMAAIGVFLSVVDIPFPMRQAVRQVGQNTAVVFVCLGAIIAFSMHQFKSYRRWIIIGATIPLFYLLFAGFVSYGFIVLTIFVGFWLARLASPRLGALNIGFRGVVLTYLMLSVFVTYMSARVELRATLWNDSAGFVERVETVVSVFSKTKLLSPFDFSSLDWLNIRLNQNILVGKVIENHETYPHLRLGGETLVLIPIAWMPRILWPGKPEMGGSAFLSKHTGIQMTKKTTFGAGPVIELFANFGYVGVFVGFIALGMIVRWIDIRSSAALDQGQFLDFARWLTVGISFIAPLTDLFFMVNTALISWIVLTAIMIVTRDRPMPTSHPA